MLTHLTLPAALQALFPFRVGEYALPGGTGVIRYVDEGTGIPVVMLHGNPTWSFFTDA